MLKKTALISLRNDYLESRKERRDSVDIEIYNLVLELGYMPILIPNEPLIAKNLNLIFKEENIGLIVFSGGNDLYNLKTDVSNSKYKKRDQLEEILIKYSISNSIPILGICRGFQMIANYLGANIEQIDGHINTTHNLIIKDFSKKIIVNSFHNYGLKNVNLPKLIEPIAIYENDNTIECFITKNYLKSINIMWHPERINGAREESIKIINNYLIY